MENVPKEITVQNKTKKGIFLAILAAAFYALNAPFSKLLLEFMPERLMAGFLYLGAGICMAAVGLVRLAVGKKDSESRLTSKDLPYTAAMILLDIAAPICLMAGLKTTAAASAALLNNFEIVATAIIALAVFREHISPRLWLGIIFITLSCTVFSVENIDGISFSGGSLLILLAGGLWGLENNCTRKISSKDPLHIVLLKGIFSGAGSVIFGLLCGERISEWWCALAALALGAAAYGLSIFFYIYAQRFLGAARTSAYYAVAPFIGAALSFLILNEHPGKNFRLGLLLMLVGAVLSASDNMSFRRKKC